MKVTIETAPLTYSYPFDYAICYGDLSGVLAICRDKSIAEEFVKNLSENQWALGIGPLTVRPVKGFEK
jgi:hypothetical protein